MGRPNSIGKFPWGRPNSIGKFPLMVIYFMVCLIIPKHSFINIFTHPIVPHVNRSHDIIKGKDPLQISWV